MFNKVLFQIFVWFLKTCKEKSPYSKFKRNVVTYAKYGTSDIFILRG